MVCLLCYLIFFFNIMLFLLVLFFSLVFFFKQKTAYEMRISDWSSDVCSSDLLYRRLHLYPDHQRRHRWSRSPDRKSAPDGRGVPTPTRSAKLSSAPRSLENCCPCADRTARPSYSPDSRCSNPTHGCARPRFRTRYGWRGSPSGSRWPYSHRLVPAGAPRSPSHAIDRTSTRLHSSHSCPSRMPPSA